MLSTFTQLTKPVRYMKLVQEGDYFFQNGDPVKQDTLVRVVEDEYSRFYLWEVDFLALNVDANNEFIAEIADDANLIEVYTTEQLQFFAEITSEMQSQPLETDHVQQPVTSTYAFHQVSEMQSQPLETDPVQEPVRSTYAFHQVNVVTSKEPNEKKQFIERIFVTEDNLNKIAEDYFFNKKCHSKQPFYLSADQRSIIVMTEDAGYYYYKAEFKEYDDINKIQVDKLVHNNLTYFVITPKDNDIERMMWQFQQTKREIIEINSLGKKPVKQSKARRKIKDADESLIQMLFGDRATLNSLQTLHKSETQAKYRISIYVSANNKSIIIFSDQTPTHKRYLKKLDLIDPQLTISVHGCGDGIFSVITPVNISIDALINSFKREGIRVQYINEESRQNIAVQDNRAALATPSTILTGIPNPSAPWGFDRTYWSPFTFSFNPNSRRHVPLAPNMQQTTVTATHQTTITTTKKRDHIEIDTELDATEQTSPIKKMNIEGPQKR